MTAILHEGDCLDILQTLPEHSIDSVVTDPPYGIAFLQRKWDYDVPSITIWRQVLRVLKPGGHLLAFGGTRTYHRMVIAVEDAGFEIRDQLAWHYATGQPKSVNLAQAIAREQPEAAQAWQGWGTSLKSCMESIVLARRPLAEKTIARNVLAFGTGGLNIDECRVPYVNDADREAARVNGLGPVERYKTTKKIMEGGRDNGGFQDTHDIRGRWPSNVIYDGSETLEDTFITFETSGSREVGSAARFFFCAKPSQTERAGSTHPTMKPLKLMAYLCRLITPKGGIVLDPFAGSGTTGLAAIQEGFQAILIEREAAYCADIRRRLAGQLANVENVPRDVVFP